MPRSALDIGFPTGVLAVAAFAGHLVTEKSDARPPAGTSVALRPAGRRALDDYTTTLRGILDGV